jgi:hypothetical protein
MDGSPLTRNRIGQENRDAIRCSDTCNRPGWIPSYQEAVRLRDNSAPSGMYNPGPVDLIPDPEFSPGQARGGEDRSRIIGAAAVSG